MNALTTSIALVAAGALAMPAVAARSHHSTSPSAIPAPSGGGGFKTLGSPTSYATGFNSEEGYSVGFLNSQQGWTTFTSSISQPTIETANPWEGDQHLRIALDADIPQGTLIGGFSPDLELGVDPDNLGSSMSVLMYVSALGGADYQIAPQSPDQGLLAARVILDFQGNMIVLDNIDGDALLEFEDTGYDYPVDSYFRLTIRLDNDSNTIDYYVNIEPLVDPGDGDLVYSSVAGVFAATSIDQVVLFSDNFSVTDHADYDQLAFDNEFDVTCVPSLDGDANDDGFTDFTDLLIILGNWGPCEADPCLGDVNCDGEVGFSDLLAALANWNPPS